jgi:hypothetical protein
MARVKGRFLLESDVEDALGVLFAVDPGGDGREDAELPVPPSRGCR